jgi:hypothetical protein
MSAGTQAKVVKNKKFSCKNEYILDKGEGKAIHVHSYSGPESSRSLRLPYFRTTCTYRW